MPRLVSARQERTSAGSLFRLPFHTCRNISCPEDKEAGRKILVGYAPSDGVLDLADDENVREYLVDAQGKQKRSPTLVHQAIRKTLKDTPDMFSVLSGGMCLVAKAAEIDDKNAVLLLQDPSIINGSQTQGELKKYFADANGQPDYIPSICYQIIVTDDEALVADVSIARNFQNDVRAISIAGRLGQLDDLEKHIRKSIPDAKLRKKETDLDDTFIDTEKLVQVLFAVSPDCLWDGFDDKQDFKNKAFTYSQKTRCLKLFQKMCADQEDPKNEKLYKFFMDVAGQAWKLYTDWKSHPGFRGTKIHAIERDDRGRIVEVPDGIIFPILAAMSAFATDESGRWKIAPPEAFDAKVLIKAAVDVCYTEIARRNPQTMGKSRACYAALYSYTSIYASNE